MLDLFKIRKLPIKPSKTNFVLQNISALIIFFEKNRNKKRKQLKMKAHNKVLTSKLTQSKKLKDNYFLKCIVNFKKKVFSRPQPN